MSVSSTSGIHGTEPMPHPFFTTVRYPWDRYEARELHRALWQAVTDDARIDFFYRAAGPNLLPLPQRVSADVIWKEALDALARARCLQRFCDLLLLEGSLMAIHRYVQAVQDAQHSATDAVAVVRTGLRALTELLNDPDVKAALAAFRAVFEGADRRIRRVSDYKDLHDRLHDVQLWCYAPISSASRQFPGAGTKAQLQLDAITLRGELRKIRNIARRETLADEDLSWIEDVERAAHLLDQGLAATDAVKVQDAARALRQVVQTQPTWVDTLLVQAVRELDLPQLVAKLHETARTLEHLGADANQRVWVEKAAEELAQLNQALTSARQNHREWQKVENTLHMFEGTLTQPWEEIMAAWQVVSGRVTKLWTIDEPWADQLQGSAMLLQKAMEARNASETLMFFSGFRTFAIDRFYEVDKQLKLLCDRITPIGRDLDQVVARLS